MNRRVLLRVILGVLLLVGLAWASTRRDLFTQQAVQTQLDTMGAWAPLAFVGLYAVATPMFAPGSALTLAGGAVFGPVA